MLRRRSGGAEAPVDRAGAVPATLATSVLRVHAGVDVLVGVGPAADAIVEGHDDAGGPGVTIPTVGRDAAAEWLRHNVSAADVVLVKASRGAALEVIAADLLEKGSSNRCEPSCSEEDSPC